MGVVTFTVTEPLIAVLAKVYPPETVVLPSVSLSSTDRLKLDSCERWGVFVPMVVELRRLEPLIDICTRFGLPGCTPLPAAPMFPEKATVKLSEPCETTINAGDVVVTDRSMVKVAETLML